LRDFERAPFRTDLARFFDADLARLPDFEHPLPDFDRALRPFLDFDRRLDLERARLSFDLERFRPPDFERALLDRRRLGADGERDRNRARRLERDRDTLCSADAGDGFRALPPLALGPLPRSPAGETEDPRRRRWLRDHPRIRRPAAARTAPGAMK